MGSGTNRKARKALGSRGGRRSGTKSSASSSNKQNRLQKFRGELKAAMKRSRQAAEAA